MAWVLAHFEQELFHLGDVAVTPVSVGIFLLTLIATILIARAIRALIHRVIARRRPDHEGAAYALGRIAQYSLVAIGVLLAVENLGISITALAAAGTVVSVGIGFGLQNIAQNFISGVILLVERPVQQGDVVELPDQTMGRVEEIGLRATRILTLDGVSVLVPNSRLITEDVRNLHAPAPENRVRIAVGVAYGSDTKLVRKVLLGVASADGRVRKSPGPQVIFGAFGESSLNFELAVWIDNAFERVLIASDLRFAIDAAFREHRIQIPFPQRDLHLVSGFAPSSKGPAA